jgi:hypothetical protein
MCTQVVSKDEEFADLEKEKELTESDRMLVRQ